MTAPHDPPDSLDDLAGEYVLGTLSAPARRDVEARLTHDAALRAAVGRWEERLLPLVNLSAPVEPSASLWPRITGTLDATHAVRQPSAARRAPGLWDSLFFWRSLAAGGMAAVLILGSSLALRPAPVPGAAQYVVVLVAPQSQAPGWVVQAQAGQNAVQLVPLAATEVPPDRALEFWTKADGWAGPVSLGLVKPGEPVRIPLDKLPPLEPNQLFELTLEPKTGSPIGKPTGPIQFIGRAVKML
ncbi:anti-sigma factor domain-containing protein [Achromobacter sp. UMC46]|uniref:anti-sigma factor n=1 Tax=Achromobacter sp. UMC46 TaxID=1862319 RepID=UPI0015FF5619|nr:anti-sigma factor [Achromobacter sp. UMC46]MBB1596893.1 RNA polymerase subunit sigma-70 [Achromobacter sp. UMC46]